MKCTWKAQLVNPNVYCFFKRSRLSNLNASFLPLNQRFIEENVALRLLSCDCYEYCDWPVELFRCTLLSLVKVTAKEPICARFVVNNDANDASIASWSYLLNPNYKCQSYKDAKWTARKDERVLPKRKRSTSLRKNRRISSTIAPDFQDLQCPLTHVVQLNLNPDCPTLVLSTGQCQKQHCITVVGFFILTMTHLENDNTKEQMFCQ